MNEDTRNKLNESIPKAAIEQRSGGGAKMLSYLSGAYVINRLNQVLGQGNWGYEIERLDKVWEGKIENYSGEVFGVSYIAQVRLYTALKEKEISYGVNSFTEVGYGDGTDKKSPGKAHELATKEAVTDALKRAAKNLGLSMGLELYFKEGQYVGEETDNTNAATVDRNTSTETPKKMEQASNKNSEAAIKTPSKVLKGQIKSAFSVLQDQKKITKEAFISEYTKGVKVDDLDDSTVNLVITKLGLNFPELGLSK